jgi:hypothetical protein
MLALCHACDARGPPARNAQGDPTCGSCQSEYVELLEEQLGDLAEQAEQSNHPAPSGSPPRASAPFELPQQALGNNVIVQAIQIDAVSNPAGGFSLYVSQGDPLSFLSGMGGGGDLEELMMRSLNSYQPPREPTSRSVLNALPRFKVEDGAERCRIGEPCSICHEAFAAGEEVVQLPCSGGGHCFHEACVSPWLHEVSPCSPCVHAGRTDPPLTPLPMHACPRSTTPAPSADTSSRPSQSQSSPQPRPAKDCEAASSSARPAPMPGVSVRSDFWSRCRPSTRSVWTRPRLSCRTCRQRRSERWGGYSEPQEELLRQRRSRLRKLLRT